MAMPVSGCLHLNNAAVSGSCISIAHAVYGASPPASVSLSTMGGIAGFTTPICMTCFYGYAGQITISNCLTMGSSGDEIVGTYYLRCSSDNSVVTSRGIPRGGTNDYFCCTYSMGDYYIDFSGLVIKTGSVCYITTACYSINGGFAVNGICTSNINYNASVSSALYCV